MPLEGGEAQYEIHLIAKTIGGLWVNIRGSQHRYLIGHDLHSRRHTSLSSNVVLLKLNSEQYLRYPRRLWNKKSLRITWAKAGLRIA